MDTKPAQFSDKYFHDSTPLRYFIGGGFDCKFRGQNGLMIQAVARIISYWKFTIKRNFMNFRTHRSLRY